MPKIQDTTTINIDNATYSVEKMSPNLKQMIVFMDAWRQKDYDLTIEIAMVKAALRDLQNNIYVTINKEKEEALQKAKAMGLIPNTEQPAAPAANDAPATSEPTSESTKA